MVEEAMDDNKEVYYKVRFDNGSEVEISKVSEPGETSGVWTEMFGEETELAGTIGELIDEHER